MNPVSSSAPNIAMPHNSGASSAGDQMKNAAPQMPIIKPAEVVSRKPSVIVLDTSGTSAASVRDSARPVEKVVQAAADAIQTFIQSKGVSLNITVDHVTGYHIIQVTDKSGNMVMQLPSEEAVRIAHSMESLQGLFVDHLA
jgi:flagellar protein FlaG